jgi:hypothetical protein
VFPILVDIDAAPTEVGLDELKNLIQDAMQVFGIGRPGESAIGTMPHPLSANEGTDILVFVKRKQGTRTQGSRLLRENSTLELGDLADNLAALTILRHRLANGDPPGARETPRGSATTYWSGKN